MDWVVTLNWLLYWFASISTDNVVLSSWLFHKLLSVRLWLVLLHLVFSSLSILFLKSSSSSLNIRFTFIPLIGLINKFPLVLLWLPLLLHLSSLLVLGLVLILGLELLHSLSIVVLESVSFPFCKSGSRELVIGS